MGYRFQPHNSSNPRPELGYPTEWIDPASVGAPHGARPHRTPEGETVLSADGLIYGPCELIEPHEDDLAGWLRIAPPAGFDNYASACT